MEIVCEGEAQIKDAETGTIYIIEADLLDWDAVGSHERQMGPETHYQARMEHDVLGMLEWNLWEYPAGAENMRSFEIGQHELIEDLDINFRHTPDLTEENYRQQFERTIQSEDDLDGISFDQLKSLPASDQVPYLTYWFGRMFEDPQNETPYSQDDSSPSNYDYIWGGPYDAREQLEHAFGGLAGDDAIESAIRHVERGGIVEWAPGPDHPDHQRAREAFNQETHEQTQETWLSQIEAKMAGDIDSKAALASPVVAMALQSLNNSIEVLREELQDASLPVQHGGMGHNQPPEPIVVNLNLTVRVGQELDTIENATRANGVDAIGVLSATKVLKSIRDEILDWGKSIYQASKKLAVAAISGTIVAGLGAKALDLLGKLDSVIEYATHLIGLISGVF